MRCYSSDTWCLGMLRPAQVRASQMCLSVTDSLQGRCEHAPEVKERQASDRLWSHPDMILALKMPFFSFYNPQHSVIWECELRESGCKQHTSSSTSSPISVCGGHTLCSAAWHPPSSQPHLWCQRGALIPSSSSSSKTLTSVSLTAWTRVMLTADCRSVCSSALP